MNDERTGYNSKVISNVKRELNNSRKLLWILFTHPQVPIVLKIIPFTAFLYWLNPIDPLPPPLNILPFDDLVALWLGLKLFVELCPQKLVHSLRHQIAYNLPPTDRPVINTTYQVLDDEQ